ncbi:MAG TPA: glutamate--tRNA ligase [Candidatus Polarisedimenticolia bacterium]|jgi:glutamyl-tRNA synthetase
MPPAVRVRFAPSPTGHLHVGNARTALFNWLYARARGGIFVLRIEDTDMERSTGRSEDAIYEDLSWLGIDWDEGPGRGGPHGPYRQSERRSLYDDAARRLLDGDRAYRCFCGPEQLEAERDAQRQAGLAPRYSGRCREMTADQSRHRASSEPCALRFRVPGENVLFDDLIRGRVEFPSAQIGDPVIVRADGSPTYNFAVVVDDAAMRITHVIRGEDHLSNTPRQILIYRALGEPPPAFAHVSLVLGPDGSPLSKRHGAASVADFRDRGFLPQAMVNYLVLLGWAHPDAKEILQVPEIVGAFSLDRVGHAASMFDVGKLTWLNAHYIRNAQPHELARLCRAGLAAAGLVPEGPADPATEDWIARALHVFAGQMETLIDAPGALRGLLRFEEHLGKDPGAQEALAGLASEPAAVRVVGEFARTVEARRPPLLDGREAFREAAQTVGRALGVKGRALFHPIRVAMTAAEKGPELDRLIPLIDEGSLHILPSPILSCAGRARLVEARLSDGAA